MLYMEQVWSAGVNPLARHSNNFFIGANHGNNSQACDPFSSIDINN